MHIKLVAVGSKMPAWVSSAFEEYAQRMPPRCRLELQEIPALRRGKKADTARILRDEAASIRAAVDPNSKIIALDRCGRSLTTIELAQYMQEWIDHSQNVAIIIGGPEGLAAEFLGWADATWSLSDLTFAHPMVRVIVAEQLYRAWSINANLPYHRAH